MGKKYAAFVRFAVRESLLKKNNKKKTQKNMVNDFVLLYP